MNKKNYQNLNYGSQKGVTLLLSILILAAMIAISFSIATILLTEVRTSGDLIRTEPAIYAADGVGEQAIFNVKRSVCSGTSCSYVSSFANSVTLPTAPVQSSTNTPIFTDKVGPQTSFQAANTYSFYNPTQGSSDAGSGYGKVTVTYEAPGGSQESYPVLSVALCQFDPTEGVNPAGAPNTYNTTACSTQGTTVIGNADNYWLTPLNNSPAIDNNGTVSLSPSGVSTVTWNLDSTKQQELFLYNQNGTSNIYVQIETYAADGQTPLGLPYAGKTSVSISTANGSVGRNINVTIPDN